MDVHPPHKPINTWKDFLLHLLTITIGLLIALTLEAAVESMHHRNVVHEARENLRREIAENHRVYAANALRVQKNRDQLGRDIDQLRDLRDLRKPDHTDLNWGWAWSSFTDSAWKTAREAGAIQYMETPAIARFSGIYSQQQYVNSTAIGILNEESRAGAALRVAGHPAKLTAAGIEALLIKSAEIDESFGALQSTMKSLDDMYAGMLSAALR